MSTKELRKSFSPSYFSMEDIMASQTRIPCLTTVTISNFGKLKVPGKATQSFVFS